VFEPAVVTVCDGNQFYAWDLHGDLRVALALNSGAYQRNLNLIVRPYGPGGFALSRS
jgi:hypothetical protein